MAKRWGVGGVFLKASNPEKLFASTVSTNCLGSSELRQLGAADARIDPNREDYAYGRFCVDMGPGGKSR